VELERALPRQSMDAARWALLAGNFVIGCGVMVVGGTLNDLTQSLKISVAQGGHLIAIAAVMMGVGAPILAAAVSRFDRRTLLTWAMLWFALGHALCALAPDYDWLWPIRALTVLSAAVFTPQAAATMGFMSTPAHRGRSITFVFMGWSIASVAGMPLAAWIGERMGWRVAMMLIALGALAAAWLVRASLPAGIKPPALSLRSWRKVLRSPLLMAVVLVTACQSAGQFTVLAYAAPYYKQDFGASPEEISLMFAWFGGLALAGNLLLNRVVDKMGAARAVTAHLAAGHQPVVAVMRPGAVGTERLCHQLWAAGTPGRFVAEAGSGIDGAEHIGHLPGPCDRCIRRRVGADARRLWSVALAGLGLDACSLGSQLVGAKNGPPP